MIYITGDIHGDIDITKLSASKWPIGKQLTKDDYLIICGDFGLIWDLPNRISTREQYWTKWLNDKPWTTLFVDGNHENFTRLKEYPIVEKFGGKVQQITDSIYHLMRGEYYIIDNKSFYTFGGASSVDRANRVENVSWWADEMPSLQEYEYGITTLEKHDWKVDYIITHCAPSSILYNIFPYCYQDSLNQFLELVRIRTEYKAWYFGHYHIDKSYEHNNFALYYDIIPIK